MSMFEFELEYFAVADVLVKIGMFLFVQALVYLILSNSSNVFSKNKMVKSLSFRPARTSSIRRIIDFISDFPLDADESESDYSSFSSSPSSSRRLHGSEFEIPSSKAD